MKFQFSNINDSNLVAPALLAIYKEKNHLIFTSNLQKKLRKYFLLDKNDEKILKGRKDDSFSQKVRNIKSHKTLSKLNLATEFDKGIKLNDNGCLLYTSPSPRD